MSARSLAAEPALCAAEPPKRDRSQVLARIWLLIAGLAYAAVLYAVVRRHEPWADEAQAWLIARDSSFTALWAKWASLEGTPVLWHSLLHALINLGLPYSGLNVVSCLLGLAATIVFLRFAPFPVWLRALIPFTYFLCFQYALVARSYSLAPLFVFACTAGYRKRISPWWASILLILLAAVSAQAYLLSVSFAVIFTTKYISERPSQRLISAGTLYLAGMLLLAWAAWPKGDATFVMVPNVSLQNLYGMTRYAFNQAFGDGYWPSVIVGLSLPVMWRSAGLTFFALSVILLSLFGALVYSNVWHHGFLVLAWLSGLWLSTPRPQIRPAMYAALALFIGVQCLWTWKAISYDWRNAYSGARSMAGYLKHAGIGPGTYMFATGFSTVAVQPYFRSNLFSNYSGALEGRSFWIWSKLNATNDSVEALGTAHPKYLLLGFSSDADERLFHGIAVTSGYEQLVRTDGRLFWRTEPTQPESFELFRAGAKTTNTQLSSGLTLQAGDNELQHQLLWGFSDANKDGRWAGANCGLMLQRPPGTSPITQFRIGLDVPRAVVETLGPMKLKVFVCGHSLRPFFLNRAGAYDLTADIASKDIFWSIVPIAMQFERAGLNLEPLRYQQIAVVSHVELSPR